MNHHILIVQNHAKFLAAHENGTPYTKKQQMVNDIHFLDSDGPERVSYCHKTVMIARKTCHDTIAQGY